MPTVVASTVSCGWLQNPKAAGIEIVRCSDICIYIYTCLYVLQVYIYINISIWYGLLQDLVS